jgi:hypothetical protein
VLKTENNARAVEAYIGEYASGKSELAINRALELHGTGIPATLVDLDFVEPFYTLRPLKAMLEERGITVIAWRTGETLGLGETGGLIKPAARWVLWRSGHIIIDVGYGANGAASLNLVEGALASSELKVWAVINTSRPITSSRTDIIGYVESLGRVDGLINNTHLGAETTPEVVAGGWRVIQEAASFLELPLIYTAVTEDLRDQVVAQVPGPVKVIHRFMPKAIW